MPKGFYFFDAIVRQEPIDESKLDPEDNLEEFALLSDEDLARIAPSVKRHRYTRGETLFSQGDEGDTFFVLVRGKLRGRVEHEGSDQVIQFKLYINSKRTWSAKNRCVSTTRIRWSLSRK